MAPLALSLYVSNFTIHYKYSVLRLILFTSRGIIILIKTFILLQGFWYGTDVSRLFYVLIITNTTVHVKSTKDKGIVQNMWSSA